MDDERGEIVCTKCGAVIQDLLSLPNSQLFNKQLSHAGPPSTLARHDGGLNTVIGQDVDSSGNKISHAMMMDFRRLRKWDSRTKSRKYSSLTRAFMILDNMVGKLSLPDNVVEMAATTYRGIFNNRMTSGRTLTSLVGVSIYVACRQCNIPRSIDDITSNMDVDRKTLYRDLSAVLQKLNITLPSGDTAQFVVRVCNNMKLPERTKRKALEIVQKSTDKMITAGKRPGVITGGAIYLAALLTGVNISQCRVAQASGVSDVSLRTIVKTICKGLDIDPLIEMKS